MQLRMPGGRPMSRYALMYRFGLTPWEGYRTAAAASIEPLLDREEAERSRPLGRALDLGCGRGQYTPELARRGGRPWASTTCRPRSKRQQPRARAWTGSVTSLVT